MGWQTPLFDSDDATVGYSTESRNDTVTIREDIPLDRLKNLEEKISLAVDKVKALKEEKAALERRIKDLETALNEKSQEVQALRSEKSSIGGQLEELLNELETLQM